MRSLAYTVHDARGGNHLLTSSTAALVLWVVLIASNLWWLRQAGAFEGALLVPRAWHTLSAPSPSPATAHGIKVAQQGNLKLDADGAF